MPRDPEQRNSSEEKIFLKILIDQFGIRDRGFAL